VTGKQKYSHQNQIKACGPIRAEREALLSRALLETGRFYREAFCGLRLTIGHETSMADADQAIEAVKQAAGELLGTIDRR